MKPTPVTFNAHNINDGSSYTSKIPIETRLQSTQARVNFTGRAGAAPSYAGKLFDGSYITLTIIALGAIASVNDKIETINQWFDVYDETPYLLVVQDEDDSNKQYYCYATPVSVTSVFGNRVIQVTLARKDPVWQSVTQNSTAWAITATGQTQAITAGGNAESYPIFEFAPTSYPAGGYNKQIYVAMYPTSAYAYPNRFLEITNVWNTSAIVGAGDMLASGDDCRVLVDGVEVPRWFGGGGINTTTTKIWITLDIPAKCETTLLTTIANTGTPATIDIVYNAANLETIQRMPVTGRVLIDSEELAYTSKNVTDTALSLGGITRTLRGTSIATHTGGSATIRWLPYDITVLYDNSAAATPVYDDTRKPVIDLTSTNTVVSWTVFADTSYAPNVLRAGAWNRFIGTNSATTKSATWPSAYANYYYADDDAATIPNPAAVMGGKLTANNSHATDAYIYWSINIPDGVTETTTSGRKYTTTTAWFTTAALQQTGIKLDWLNCWTSETVPSANTWTAWSHNAVTATAGTVALRLYMEGLTSTTNNDWMKFDAGAVSATLVNPPTIVFRTAASVMYIDSTMTNTTTGEFLSLAFPLQTGKTLVIDTDPNNPSAKIDGQIVSGISPNTNRTKWLRLTSGSNTLTYTCASNNNITCTVKWRDRMNFL